MWNPISVIANKAYFWVSACVLLIAPLAVCPLADAQGRGYQPLRPSQNLRAAMPTEQTGDFPEYMLSLVNADRSQNGSEPVKQNAKLQRLAQVYAEYLLNSGFFGHVDPFGRNPQDRAQLYGVNTGVSENLAYQMSTYEGPTILIQRAQGAMMAEPVNQINHRYNILNPRSKYVGIGVARAGNKVLMVQEFSEDEP